MFDTSGPRTAGGWWGWCGCWAFVLLVSAGAATGCGPEQMEEEDLYLEVGNACSLACRVDERCSSVWQYAGECAPWCVDQFEGPARVLSPSRCLSVRLDLANCQADLTCEEFEDLQSDEPNPCSAEDREVEDLCD